MQDYAETRLFALQDQQYNVLALVTANGDLAERYEYTLYGERQVYRAAGEDIGATLQADLDGNGTVDATDQGIVLNHWGQSVTPNDRASGDATGDGLVNTDDLNFVITHFGNPGTGNDPHAQTPSTVSAKLPFSGAPLSTIAFQGLRLDETTGLIDNRYRIYDPAAGRYIQPDPLGYPDGLNRYAAYHVLRGGVDPFGMAAVSSADRYMQEQRAQADKDRALALQRIRGLDRYLDELHRQVGRLGKMIVEGGCCPTEQQIDQYRRKAQWITTMHERYHSRRAALVRELTNNRLARSPLIQDALTDLSGITPYDNWSSDTDARNVAFEADAALDAANKAHADDLDAAYRILDRTETALNNVSLLLGPVAVVRHYGKKGVIVVAVSLTASAAVGQATGYASSEAVRRGWATEEEIQIAALFIRTGMTIIGCRAAGSRGAGGGAGASNRTVTQVNNVRGWKVGDPINNLTQARNTPAWNTVRQRYWKNEALNNANNYSPANVDRMKRGLAPQRVNPNTGRVESMELHHTPPQREGGLFDVEPVWPDEHAAVDPFRNTGN